MSFLSLLVHDVTILTAPTGPDRYDNDEPDWEHATSTTAKAWISQRSRSENLTGRDALVSGWVIFLPPDTDISGRERLVWGDITFELDGPPLPAWTPRGLHHLEAQLRVVDG